MSGKIGISESRENDMTAPIEYRKYFFTGVYVGYNANIIDPNILPKKLRPSLMPRELSEME